MFNPNTRSRTRGRRSHQAPGDSSGYPTASIEVSIENDDVGTSCHPTPVRTAAPFPTNSSCGESSSPPIEEWLEELRCDVCASVIDNDELHGTGVLHRKHAFQGTDDRRRLVVHRHHDRQCGHPRPQVVVRDRARKLVIELSCDPLQRSILCEFGSFTLQIAFAAVSRPQGSNAIWEIGIDSEKAHAEGHAVRAGPSTFRGQTAVKASAVMSSNRNKRTRCTPPDRG